MKDLVVHRPDKLSHGDNLIVDKITYRFKAPQRFDIIVFPFEYEEDTYYIKRIIGLKSCFISLIFVSILLLRPCKTPFHIRSLMLQNAEFGKRPNSDPCAANERGR